MFQADSLPVEPPGNMLSHQGRFSVAKSCPTLCDRIDCSSAGFPVLQSLLKDRISSLRVCSQSRPLCWWCHPTISSLVVSSLLVLNLSQHQGLFQWVGSSHQVTKVLQFQLQHHSFQWTFRVDFLWNWLVLSPCSPRDSQEFSPAPQFKNIHYSVLSLLYVPALISIHD